MLPSHGGIPPEGGRGRNVVHVLRSRAQQYGTIELDTGIMSRGELLTKNATLFLPDVR